MASLDVGDGKVVHGSLSGLRVDQWRRSSNVAIIVEPSRIRERTKGVITGQDGELGVARRISGPISTYVDEPSLWI
jgi:hypothetical protein